MIADRIEGVAVAALLFHAGKRPRAEFFVEDPITQGLRSVDVGGARRKPHLQRPRADIDNPAGCDGDGRVHRRRWIDRHRSRFSGGAGDHVERLRQWPRSLRTG